MMYSRAVQIIRSPGIYPSFVLLSDITSLIFGEVMGTLNPNCAISKDVKSCTTNELSVRDYRVATPSKSYLTVT